MTVELQRTLHTDKQVTGCLNVADPKRIFRTLELAWKDNAPCESCIPAGRYDVVKRNSPKYGDHFHVLNVPNRSYILIHAGNFNRDTKGCILVGTGLNDINSDGYMDVTNSRRAMRELNELLPDSFTLIVREV